MIDVQYKIHDKFSLEFKIGFHANGRDKNQFAVNMWIFVPNSLDINPGTYTKRQFYRDMKSNVRLITPVFLLRDLAREDSLPLRNLESSFRSLASNPDRVTVVDYEYQIKMFMSILKSSVRDEINHIMGLSAHMDVEPLCTAFARNVTAITGSYRRLRSVVNVATVPKEVFNYYLFGDEFMSNLIEKNTFRLVCRLEQKYGDKHMQSVELLKTVIAEEIRHHYENQYPQAETNSASSNREIVFRQSVLKKYIESDLFLHADKKRDAVVQEQLYLSLAAGISMIFATAIAFSFQQRFGNFTMPLFVALVVSYMLKDRIKESMRYWFAYRLGSKYFDNKTTVSLKEQKLGWIKDGVDFITEQKTPREVMVMRSRSPLLQAENRISDEKILLFRKLVQLDGGKLAGEDRYTVSGINEILRFNLTNFIQKMDNPEVPLYTLDGQNNVVELSGKKVYYLNFILQLQHDDQLDYKRIRLTFNRNGIIRIEEFK